MEKNGFTFIEILGVIAVLSLIGTIILIAVDKSLKESKQSLYNTQIENIKSAAEMWKADNIDQIPNSGYTNITLATLKQGGYIGEVKNPKTNEPIEDTLIIRIGMNDIQIQN